jgi:hypothetical protein
MVLVEVGEAEAFDATSWAIVAPDADVHKARRTAAHVDVVRLPPIAPHGPILNTPSFLVYRFYAYF